jgi:hypothetical protein
MTEIIDRPQILTPSMSRRPEVQEAYDQHTYDKHIHNDTSCDLCRLVEDRNTQLGKNILGLLSKNWTIVENEFPYFHYDGFEIVKHHLLIPKQHNAELANMHVFAQLGYVQALKRIVKSREYHVVVNRAPHSDGSSVPAHMHTHLMRQGSRITEQHYSERNNISTVEFRSRPDA